jgi:hypothetical protein
MKSKVTTEMLTSYGQACEALLHRGCDCFERYLALSVTERSPNDQCSCTNSKMALWSQILYCLSMRVCMVYIMNIG